MLSSEENGETVEGGGEEAGMTSSERKYVILRMKSQCCLDRSLLLRGRQNTGGHLRQAGRADGCPTGYLQGAQTLTNLSTFFASSLLFPCCRFSLGVFSIGQKWGFEVSMRFTPMASQSHFGEELLVTISALEGLKTDFKQN